MLGFWPIPMCKLTEFGGSPAENSGGFQWPIGAMEITGPTRRVCHPWPMDVSKIYDWDPQLDGGSKQGKLQPLGHFLSRFWTSKKVWVQIPSEILMSPRWCIWVGCSRLVSTLWWTYYSKSCGCSGCSISHGQIRVGWGESVNPWFMNHFPVL